MSGSQVERDFLERLVGEERQRLGLDAQHIVGAEFFDGNKILGEQTVLSLVRAKRKHFLIMEWRCDHAVNVSGGLEKIKVFFSGFSSLATDYLLSKSNLSLRPPCRRILASCLARHRRTISAADTSA